MKRQYEQHCNAAALQLMGVPVLKNFKKKQRNKINSWIVSGVKPSVDYPDETSRIIDDIIGTHAIADEQTKRPVLQKKEYTLKELKKLSLQKILAYVAG